MLLAGCSASTSVVSDSVRQLLSPPAADSAPLNPDYRYLRVTAGKNVALLVLGYTDAVPQAGTEVWYSADKETIRLWRGRVAGTAGLNTDWRAVAFTDLPTWRAALPSGAGYFRQRDVMPGYAMGVREQVRIVPVAPPTASALKDVAPQDLQWFEERATPEGVTAALPPARFAVDLSGGQERVVYSEQCLSATLCLTLQQWPARPRAVAATAPAPLPARSPQ